MQARELLSVLPADLIKSILARREKLAAQLPKELELRQEENDRAFQLAKTSREELKALQADSSDSNVNEDDLLKPNTPMTRTNNSVGVLPRAFKPSRTTSAIVKKRLGSGSS